MRNTRGKSLESFVLKIIILIRGTSFILLFQWQAKVECMILYTFNRE